MLRFKVHSFQLGAKHCVLLPKLTFHQLRLIARSFERSGCSIKASNPVVARAEEGTVRVTMTGLCISTFDASDLVFPLIPELLALSKELVPLEAILGMYFAGAPSDRFPLVRLAPRLEHSSMWRELRRTGQCGLAPDEHTICTSLIESARSCGLVTDYPIDGAEPFIVGRRRYYRTDIERDEAISTLRVTGNRKARNSYILHNGALQLFGFSAPMKRRLTELIAETGDWCSFRPAGGKV